MWGFGRTLTRGNSSLAVSFVIWTTSASVALEPNVIWRNDWSH